MILGLLAAGVPATQAQQAFDNQAKDSLESPFIKRVTASVKDHCLVLRFEGNLALGRQANVLKTNTHETFHHADTKLTITFNNEVLENEMVTVASGTTGKLELFPAQGTVATAATFTEVAIPLTFIRCTPVQFTAETETIYFANATNQAAAQGRNLFSTAAGPATLDIPGLERLNGASVISNLQVADIGVTGAGVVWQSNHRLTRNLQVKTADGTVVKTVAQDYRARRHKVSITGLKRDTAYTIIVSGNDMEGRAAVPATTTFRTLAADTVAATATAWLQVRGTSIVDSAGRPFVLGAYSTDFGDYWHNEFPRYGTFALTARYFRAMGLNACRIGIEESMPDHWAASVMRDGSAIKAYGGPTGYVKKFIRPLVDQVIGEGLYAIIDWHGSYGLTDEKIEMIGQFWEACAKEFKDEPRVAMYQLLNEPCFKDGQNRPDLAPRIRQITKDYIQRIRKHDQKHILLVSDWNCGWGWATESQWGPVDFDPGDPYRQIVYSKHISREHFTDAFMAGGVDAIADKWDVPLIFDEVENGALADWRDTEWFYAFLRKNPRNYGFAVWVCGQYWPEFPQITAAFAQTYLPQPSFPPEDTHAIVAWWWLTEPKVTAKDGSYYYHFRTPATMDAGAYGLTVQLAPPNTPIEVAVERADAAGTLAGVWLGTPGAAAWLKMPGGANAVPGAGYLQAVTPFSAVVLKTSKKLDTLRSVQLFRLNPRHSMPVPNVVNVNVK